MSAPENGRGSGVEDVLRFQALMTMLLRPNLDRTQTTEDALARLALRYREENPVEGADRHAPAAWSYAAEAEVRLNALRVVEETLDGVGRAALFVESDGDVDRIRDALAVLRRMLEAVHHAAATIEDGLAEALQLDPAAPGGGKVKNRQRGADPSLLTVAVKALLRERFPEWDGTPMGYPGGNTQDLRNWLRDRLSAEVRFDGPGGYLALFPRGPFPPNQIDPRYRGPLHGIVETLRNAR